MPPWEPDPRDARVSSPLRSTLPPGWTGGPDLFDARRPLELFVARGELRASTHARYTVGSHAHVLPGDTLPVLSAVVETSLMMHAGGHP